MSDKTNGAGVVRLSLNVPAVERLLAGDPELEIHMREQVKEQVFKNHLGALLDDPAIGQMAQDFAVKIREYQTHVSNTYVKECEKQIGTIQSHWNEKTLLMSPTFKAKMETTIQQLLDPTVRMLVEQHAAKITEVWLAIADKTIQKKLDAEIEKRISDGINQRLVAAAKAVKEST